MKNKLFKSITSFMLVIAMVVGMTATLGGKAEAATYINIAYAAGDNAKINGGSVLNVRVQSGKATTITTVRPTRSGCNFLGWTTTKNSGRIDYKSGQSVTFTKATTLWPVWNANIAYAADDGKFANGAPVANVSVTLGKATTVPTAVPQKSGYTCIGWNTTKGSTSVQYKPGAAITYTEPKTYWPVWEKNAPSINITYAAGDSATINNSSTYVVSAKSGKATTITTVKPSRSGCNFLGWTTTKNSGRIDYKSGQSATFTAATTLWPVWNANIAYAAGDGSFNGSPVANVSVTLGQATTIITSVPTLSGYTFKGWTTTKGSSTIVYKSGQSVTFTTPMTLWPVWEKIIPSINITYAAGDSATINNSSTYVVSVKSGVATTITTVKPSRSNCSFLGWTTTKNSGRIDYKSGQSATFTNATTLYPVWSANIAYSAGDGKINGSSVSNVSVTLGQTTTIISAVPTLSGYTFQGWTTTKGSSTVVYKSGQSVTFTAPTTLWPVWKENVVMINITYAAGDSATINNSSNYVESAQSGKATTITTVKPSRPPCNFLGWTTEKNSGRVDYTAGQSATFTASTTLWPVWNANIAYAAGDGSFNGSPIANVSVTLGQATKIITAVPTLSGYTFQGWTTTKGSTTVVYNSGATVTFTAPTTLWPVWKGSTVTISYNLNGGTWKNGSTSQTYTNGISSLTPPDCVLAGYSLVGWNTKSDGSGTMYQKDQANASFSSDTTLYAIWAGTTCTITYHENGGQVGHMGSNGMTQSFTVGENVTLSPPNFYREGCTLLGFATEANATSAKYAVNGSYKFNMSMNLYAIWQGTITYDANGGSFVPGESNTQKFIIGTQYNISAPQLKEREGYVFHGFSTTGNMDTTIYTDGYGPVSFSSSVKLYAIWEVIPSHVLPSESIRLKNADSFVVVYETDSTTYGADQGRYTATGDYMLYYNNLYNNNHYDPAEARRIQTSSACGLFSSVNTYLYLVGERSVTHDEFDQELLYICEWGKEVWDGIWDVLVEGPNDGDSWTFMSQIIEYFLRVCYYKDLDFSLTIENCSDRDLVESRIISMLRDDIPVLLSYDGDSSLLEYELNPGSTVLTKSGWSFKSHYFIVTGVYLDPQSGKIRWLEVSSDGKHAYIFFEHYWKQKNSLPYANGYIWIR
jgi:hypothetical protein